MKRPLRIAALTLAVLLHSALATAYLINNYWNDGSDIVIDDVLLPAETWSSPAQFQMSEWNQVDTTDNSHAFRINLNPQFSFGSNDGDNTMGFLDEAGLRSEYGLSFSNALAWTICWTPWFSSRYDECDVVMDSGRFWSLHPHDSTWFQSTILHELGHVRGLGHYNNYLSMQNSGTSKYLRGETLYMDDKEGVRQHASHVGEQDAVIYGKWHDGSGPRWMSLGPTTLREGDFLSLQNVTIENRGTQTLAPLRFGIYLSTNTAISTGDQLMSWGSFSSFGRFTYSTFDWSTRIPPVSDCGTYYVGGIVDDDHRWSERFEGNNAVAFSNGNPFVGSSFVPTPLSITLAPDRYEPNEGVFAASTVPLPFHASVTMDVDAGNDYYRIDLPSSDRLEIVADFVHSRGNLELELLSSGGAVIAASRTTTDDESVTVTAGPGTHYVRVYAVGSGSCNRYSLSIRHGSPCGDGVCSAADGEDHFSCPNDCSDPCGNGLCEPSKGEDHLSCPVDCENPCGNGLCEFGEKLDCPADCGTSCGDGFCDARSGEDATSCSVDCCDSTSKLAAECPVEPF